VKSAKTGFIGTNRAFTLVEMFIVGALIALFAGIAIFNIQGQYLANIRKITVAEVNQIHAALSFVKMDTGTFPKLNFLNKALYHPEISLLTGNVRQLYLRDDFDYMGYPIGSALESTILSQWRGPYYSVSHTRRGIGRAIGGVVSMLLPNTGIVTDWPADAYGEPYVLYLIRVTETGGLDWVRSATEEANYFAAVVSYGRNRVPGYKADMPIPVADFNRLKNERLYKEGGSGNDVYGNPRAAQFTALTSDEYDQTRLRALTKIGRGGISEDEVGIIDAGSDDIIYEF
jgi:type II secretory pathway pseudopilin PulG